MKSYNNSLVNYLILISNVTATQFIDVYQCVLCECVAWMNIDTVLTNITIVMFFLRMLSIHSFNYQSSQYLSLFIIWNDKWIFIQLLFYFTFYWRHQTSRIYYCDVRDECCSNEWSLVSLQSNADCLLKCIINYYLYISIYFSFV